MGLARLILLAVIGGADAREPAALIVDLASDRPAVRVEAAGVLEELGRPALPALYQARGSDDPELRRQVEPLIDLIERQRLLRATRVRLDFDETPIAAVADDLRAQTGFPVVVGPDESLRARRVTLHAPGLVPFWESLDRVAAASGVRHNPGVPFSPALREPTVLLGIADGPPVPSSDDGPFRFHLVRFARHREVTPVRPPADPKSRESLSAEIHVFAEPGLAVSPIGPVLLKEAVDDRGRDLRLDPPVGPAPGRVLPPRFEEGHAARFALQIPLKPGAGPGGRLRRLKGRVRVAVIARTGDPIIVPLAGAAGRPFSTAGTTLSVGVVRTVAETASFQFAIREEQADGRFARGRALEVGGYRPPDQVEYHVQLQDDRGRMLWWDAGPLRSAEGGGLETSITVNPSPGGTPARLLYHGVIGAAAMLFFEFHDLPLP